jgi:hypothetical protein
MSMHRSKLAVVAAICVTIAAFVALHNEPAEAQSSPPTEPGRYAVTKFEDGSWILHDTRDGAGEQWIPTKQGSQDAFLVTEFRPGATRARARLVPVTQ